MICLRCGRVIDSSKCECGFDIAEDGFLCIGKQSGNEGLLLLADRQSSESVSRDACLTQFVNIIQKVVEQKKYELNIEKLKEISGSLVSKLLIQLYDRSGKEGFVEFAQKLNDDEMDACIDILKYYKKRRNN